MRAVRYNARRLIDTVTGKGKASGRDAVRGLHRYKMETTGKLLLLSLCSLVLMVSVCEALEQPVDGVERWYSSSQVNRGKVLFELHCRECHGEAGRSVSNWKQRGADGFFPPPPLDGTAHSWHHDLELLRRIIREGGVNSGGKMPPFTGKLDAAEIDAVIAAFQSYWPDEIYRRWNGTAVERYPMPEIIREILGEGS